LRRVLAEAAERPGETAENLVELLEQRLDALVWRAGFAPNIQRARELVGHNNFTIDGSKVDLPSYRLRPGQTVQVREARRDKMPFLVAAGQQAVGERPPPYLDVEPALLSVTLTREPRRHEVPVLRDEELMVEVHRG
jgi:small subunit ribosomal protein S4